MSRNKAIKRTKQRNRMIRTVSHQSPKTEPLPSKQASNFSGTCPKELQHHTPPELLEISELSMIIQ